ncbi:secretion system X translation initiation factor [Aromatoleum diolicum]|uniref:Secretion system X translation initiation factor n=1 Tax=Aromatoleum diolicum TaxID=75796 RepID=A0ABX1QE38_9RHOO|nr:secretion system X translation initiation factor [Aromatoleum diolicum]NMG75661.1 secretion system X translation initiation factor [Aromatoleum diolicum]
MAKRRNVFWLIFLGAAIVLALIPEFFDAPPEEVVQPVPPTQRRGQLAELRSPPAATATTATPAEGTAALPTPGDAVSPAGTAAAPSQAAQRAGSAAGPEVDLFAAHSWYVAPPPPPTSEQPVAPVAPPKPVAPPLPFEYFGKLDDSERVRVFLQRGDRIYTVGVGDVIDGTYKVKSITDSQMTLIYLPLDLTQTLSVGSKL